MSAPLGGSVEGPPTSQPGIGQHLQALDSAVLQWNPFPEANNDEYLHQEQPSYAASSVISDSQWSPALNFDETPSRTCAYSSATSVSEASHSLIALSHHGSSGAPVPQFQEQRHFKPSSPQEPQPSSYNYGTNDFAPTDTVQPANIDLWGFYGGASGSFTHLLHQEWSQPPSTFRAQENTTFQQEHAATNIESNEAQSNYAATIQYDYSLLDPMEGIEHEYQAPQQYISNFSTSLHCGEGKDQLIDSNIHPSSPHGHLRPANSGTGPLSAYDRAHGNPYRASKSMGHYHDDRSNSSQLGICRSHSSRSQYGSSAILQAAMPPSVNTNGFLVRRSLPTCPTPSIGISQANPMQMSSDIPLTLAIDEETERQKRHANAYLDKLPPEKISGSYVCKVCRKQFANTSGYRRHCESEGFVFYCPFACSDYIPGRLDNLNGHMKSVHGYTKNVKRKEIRREPRQIL